MIKVVVLDIDGVITDGSIYINENLQETKRFNFKDVDAIFAIKKMGFKLAIITSENNSLTKYFQKRFAPDFFVCGSNNKLLDLEKISQNAGANFDEICYVGDGYKDFECINKVGLGISPSNAIGEVKEVSKIILKSSGGDGAIVELLNVLKHHYKRNVDFWNLLQQHAEISKKIKSDIIIYKNINTATSILIKALNNKKKLMFCGNGGSAADAQHLATEFVSRFLIERKALPAIALNTNTSTLLAIGNDYTFDKVFSRQVESYGNAGDVLIGITTSGKSKNILEAFSVAKFMGIKTICLTSSIAEDVDCDCIIKVPSQSTPRIQEFHIMIGHYLCEVVEKSLFGGII